MLATSPQSQRRSLHGHEPDRRPQRIGACPEVVVSLPLPTNLIELLVPNHEDSRIGQEELERVDAVLRLCHNAHLFRDSRIPARDSH